MRFKESLENRRILVTGHTGFKGGWLSLWLQQLGAEVSGISLAPDTDPNLFEVADLKRGITHRVQDIRDKKGLERAIDELQPEIVFHLAAQPLVRPSYDDPIYTFETNTMGTVHLLEALRGVEALRAVLCITTDKVYHNLEQDYPYCEGDLLGGKDPYSASKSAAEMVVGGYRGLFRMRDRPVAIATARGGNVIGGGDWSADRLIPDLVRAIAADQKLVIRNPQATRPWQHVLCLCHGYLDLMHALLTRPDEVSQPWNFGPGPADTVPVADVLERFGQAWALPEIAVVPETDKPESQLLALDSRQAHEELGWYPAWSLQQALPATAHWYKEHAQGANMREVMLGQIESYVADMAIGGAGV